MKLPVGCFLVAWFLSSLARAQTNGVSDLSTTNREQIQHFWQAMDRSNGPVTVLAFGDSVSDSYRSIQEFVFGDLAAKFGLAGYTIGNFDNFLLWTLTNGASISQPTTNWWAAHGLLPSGSSIFWTNQSSATGSLLSDQVGVFWVAQPGGGAFTLSVSTNGGEWSGPLLTLDGYGTSSAGRYASLPLPPQPYRLRVDGLSGTNVIIGPQYVLNGSAGINVSFISQDGANLDKVFAVSTNVLYPILSALNPQLVIWHMKELADIGATELSNRLYNLEALWQNSVTNGDIVYIGTPYDMDDLTSVFTPVQNQLVRQAAVRANRAYIDCMTPCVSYQWMTNNGFLDDTIHPSNTCNGFLADIVWQELGLFALRTDRELALDLVGGFARLHWNTSPNINYELQSSSDLIHWTSLETVPGDGGPHSHTNFNSTVSDTFFRLSLTQ